MMFIPLNVLSQLINSADSNELMVAYFANSNWFEFKGQVAFTQIFDKNG